jgi:hypothetical protein
MRALTKLRVARPTDNLDEVTRFYKMASDLRYYISLRMTAGSTESCWVYPERHIILSLPKLTGIGRGEHQQRIAC